MKTLLTIHSSPRREKSGSTQLAEHFANHLQATDKQWRIDTIDLWQEPLPAMTGNALNAKYAAFEGLPLDDEQQRAWRQIEQHVQRFARADAVVFAVPIWNFSIPYVLKHYIDVITQPGLSFSWQPDTGYTSLLPAKAALIMNSSGSDYREGTGNQTDDFGLRYLERWLTVYMNCRVNSIILAPTVGEPASVAATKEQAFNAALSFAKNF